MLPQLSNGRKRRELIFNQLVLSNPLNHSNASSIQLLVCGRRVCAPIFCEHWCISRPTLDRYLRHVREGHREFPGKTNDQRKPRDNPKRDFITTWFIQYAAEVTEKLPDCPLVLLPRMEWKEMHKMYVDDMSAAGYGVDTICKIDHFRNIFKTAEELAHMQMTTFKRNFSKCSECIELSAAVSVALKSHDPVKVEKAKAARLEHYLLARSDKRHYWQQRSQVQ